MTRAQSSRVSDLQIGQSSPVEESPSWTLRPRTHVALAYVDYNLCRLRGGSKYGADGYSRLEKQQLPSPLTGSLIPSPGKKMFSISPFDPRWMIFSMGIMALSSPMGRQGQGNHTQ